MDYPYLKIEVEKYRALLEPHFSAETSLSGKLGDPPSTGHCAAVAIILQFVLGGELRSTKLQGRSHWYNHIHEHDVDITGDQFGGPAVQVAKELYRDVGWCLRSKDEVNAKTMRRAQLLAERAGISLERRVGLVPSQDILEASIRAGVHNPDGTLARRYRDPTPEEVAEEEAERAEEEARQAEQKLNRQLRLFQALASNLIQALWKGDPVIDTGVFLSKDFGPTRLHYKVKFVLHRTDGPAVEYGEPGTKCWFKDGQRHRIDGPAIEHPSGEGTYWIEDKELTKEEFLARTQSSSK